MKKLLTKKLVLFLFFLGILINISHVDARARSFKIGRAGQDSLVYDVNLELEGRAIRSDYEPFILNDRTFVPVRLVAEYFDSQVEWIRETKTVLITKAGDRLEIQIDSDQATKNGQTIRLDQDSIPLLVTYPDQEGKTVLPLRAISELMGYKVDWDGEKRLVSISQIKSSNRISQIKIIKKEDRNDQVELISSQGIKWQAQYDQDHNSLNLSFEDFIFDIDQKDSDSLKINSDLIEKIEYANKTASSSEMRIELKRGVSHKIRALAQGKGVNICFINEITAVRPINFQNQGAILVEGAKNSSYNIIKLKDPYRYVIDLKDAELYGNIEGEEIPLGLGFTERVRVSRFSPDANYDKNDAIVRLVLDAREGIEGGEAQIIRDGDDLIIIPSGESTDLSNFGNKTVIRDGKEQEVEIQEKKPRIKPNSRSEVVIYLDPGHGGKDSGAISPEGQLEKTYALDISQTVDRLLREQGYNVTMTRETDVFINLYDRPDMANKANAHVFVSIHLNSSPNPMAKGMEILYAPRDDKNIKYDPQYPLADEIHKEMQKLMDIKSRGIKKRPDLVVLRLTEMPAVLVEAGFMSNSEELERLKDPAYREACALGIANGIKSYIEKTYGY